VWPGSIHGALVVELVEASTLSFHIVLTFPVQTILLRYHPSHIGQGAIN